ncbi:MAG: PQQ-binding-like beta-propeller repeat protein, partial [Lachnospiraceae bacterium]|nr:PQQ-binding-like beta-propeller repeat protein [Lachnospiraceae bacterium]
DMKILDFIKKNRGKCIAAAVVVIVLILMFVGFKTLVKVGNPKYFYNYMHDTAGSLDVVYNASATDGADRMNAYSTDETDPAAHKVVERLRVNGTETGSYTRSAPIDFSYEFAAGLKGVKGLLTFRGNYTRSMTSVGNAAIESEKFTPGGWTYSTGKVLKSNGVDYWSGNGWTGQPVIVRWDEDVKKTMNLFDSAKNKKGLTEVIYPGMDGCIHFLDIETGEETRPSIYVGMTFKGTASLYPDGTPLLFCGSGDAQTGQFGENVCQRFYIYSLIDGTLLYEGGYNDDFAPRTWHAYDSSPVIDPVTDTLIQPGENGVIYTMRLNTSYDRASGSLSIAPSEFVDYTFTIDGKYSQSGYLWGSECSAAVCGGYLYIGDNAGTFYCLDLNTMKMVWVQELNEDINSSPIFEAEGSNKYVYIATTLKYNYNSHSMGEAAIYKINAMNGSIIWKKPYEVHTVKGYAGGVLSTGVPGSGIVGDYIFYSVSKLPEIEGGMLVALNKHTGKEEWTLDLDMYSWSSSVLTFSQAGRAYLLQGCQNGDLLLINAANGKVLDKRNFGSGIEATPVIFGNRIVLATRSEKIIGISIE